MLEQRIQQQFFESADLAYQSAEPMARAIAAATQAIVAALTAGGRVMVAGSGASHALATLLVDAMVGRFERERPGLAALRLAPHDARADAARLVRETTTLGQPGDLVLLVDAGEATDALRQVASAAQAHEMTVVVLGSDAPREPSPWLTALGETDVFVGVPHERASRLREMHLLAMHCLCEAVDRQLLGDEDKP